MIQIGKETIKEYATLYDDRYQGTNDEKIEQEIKAWLKANKWLDREQFIKLGLWKSRRQKTRYEDNDGLTVKEITRFSLGTKSEKARIESLLVLNGVSYPMASVILHFAYPRRYPILDRRVLMALGGAWHERGVKQNYDFNFWQKFCDKMRNITKEVREDARTVDKALWEYSKRDKHQLLKK